jgi:serine/threonine protein kinase
MKYCPNCCDNSLVNDICPACGYVLGSEEPPLHTLPYGTVLQDRYFVGKVLGEGGFGITYLGYDLRLEAKIAVKEYYPTGFVSREPSDNTHTVRTYTGSKEEFFKRGLNRFINEAKCISKFLNSPGVVNVIDVFSENGTAYIAMEFIEGTSLSDILKNYGEFNEASMLEMFLPIIKTLAKIHAEGIIHRDIAPDNIMVQRDGTAKLIDFGAATQSSENGDRSTVALVKHGYAAEEQYDSTHKRQGTWSDVYSLSATMYRTLTGNTPPEALDRLRGEPLPEIEVPVSETVKNAIYHGMAVSPKDRTQTMDELYAELTSGGAANKNNIRPKNEQGDIEKTIPLTKPVTLPDPAPASEVIIEPVQKKGKKPKIAILGAIAAAAAIALAIILMTSTGGNDIEQVNARLTRAEETTTKTEEPIAEISEAEAAKAEESTAETTTAAETIATEEITIPETTTTTAEAPVAVLQTAVTTAATAPATTTAAAPPANNLPPAKSSFYTAPNYRGLKLSEGVKYEDGGRIRAYSHSTDGSWAGFTIDYSPNSYLVIATANNGIGYMGAGESIYISLAPKDFGMIQIGDTYNGAFDGEMVEFTGFDGDDVRWDTESDSKRMGLAYCFDGTNMYLRNYEGKDNITSEQKLDSVSIEDGKRWYLDNNNTLVFEKTNRKSGFKVKRGNEYVFSNFAYTENDNGIVYLGQCSDDLADGLGIFRLADAIIIGQCESGYAEGYGLEITPKGKTYFVKTSNGKRTRIEEIKGMELDLEALFGV